MAISTAKELDAVAAVSRRLRVALDHARAIKTSTTVDPPLPTSALEDSAATLQDDLDAVYDQSYRFAAVETAVRDLFYSLITSTAIDEPAFVEVWNLLDILLVAGDAGKCAPELVVWLVEELLDSQTTEGCKTVFDYLESRRDRLAQKDFHKKNLVFLRSCNELLRRLSRAEDASFCGRVFFFLFQTFPLGDKSSVNLRGEFHIENSTLFDDEGPEISLPDAKSGSSTPLTAPARPGARAAALKKADEPPLDSQALYRIFWRLQQTFSDPTRLFQGANLKAFKGALNATINKFKNTATVVQSRSADASEQDGSGESGAEYSENYNPKYLTSKDLFDLELSDQAFQRHILVQALILLDFLLSLTEEAKQKLATIEHPNKSMLYDYTLSAEDAAWAVSTGEAIRQYFAVPADGLFYNRMVNTILSRDKNWIRWKIQSCPSIVRDAVTTDEMLDVQSKVQRMSKPRRVDAQPMGAMDLDFLEDDSAGGLDALREASRFTAPSVEELWRSIQNDELDAEMATDEEKAGLDTQVANKSWRMLRQLRADQLGSLGRYEVGRRPGELLQSNGAERELEKVA